MLNVGFHRKMYLKCAFCTSSIEEGTLNEINFIALSCKPGKNSIKQTASSKRLFYDSKPTSILHAVWKS